MIRHHGVIRDHYVAKRTDVQLPVQRIIIGEDDHFTGLANACFELADLLHVSVILKVEYAVIEGLVIAPADVQGQDHLIRRSALQVLIMQGFFVNSRIEQVLVQLAVFRDRFYAAEEPAFAEQLAATYQLQRFAVSGALFLVVEIQDVHDP